MSKMKKQIFNYLKKEISKQIEKELPEYNKRKREFIEAVSQSNIKHKYCSNCGAVLNEGSNYCPSCGKAINKKVTTEKSNEDFVTSDGTERVETIGVDDKAEENSKKEIIKCPNCGASINSFEYKCPYCRTELRNIEASSAMEKFSQEFEKIKSRPLPKYDGKESIMKKLVGHDYNQDRERFYEDAKDDRDEEIASFIRNYPVPNTKEDLVEFMILAKSNYDHLSYEDEDLRSAWNAKMNQIVQKAKLTIKNPNDLKPITDIYDEKEKAISNDNKMIIKTLISGMVIVILIFLFLISR